MNKQVLREILDVLEKDQKAALAMLTGVSGSVPGRVGAMLGVLENGRIIGTIGGGVLEFSVGKQAQDALVSEEHRQFMYDLNESGELGMSCGGTAQGFITVLKPNDKLVIFGAGHISQKIAAFAKNLNFDLFIVDDREEYKNQAEFSQAREYITGKLEQALGKINFSANTYIVLATRDPEMDLAALRGVIRSNVPYIGMIGSKKKIGSVKETLRQEGISEEMFAKLRAPVGLNIDDGSPEEIAVAIIAEILMTKNKKNRLTL